MLNQILMGMRSREFNFSYLKYLTLYQNSTQNWVCSIKTNILELRKLCMIFSIQNFEVHIHPKIYIGCKYVSNSKFMSIFFIDNLLWTQEKFIMVKSGFIFTQKSLTVFSKCVTCMSFIFFLDSGWEDEGDNRSLHTEV